MEETQFKLLEHLNDSEYNRQVNIAPFLSTLYPDSNHAKEWRKSAIFYSRIDPILTYLKDKGYLSQNETSEETERIHRSTFDDGKHDFKDLRFAYAITPEGRRAYEDEVQRRRNVELTESQIKTNKATYNSLKASIGFSAVSILLVIITSIQTCTSKTDQNLSAIHSQMEKDKKAFDSINSNLEKLYKAVQNKKNDTTNKPLR